VNSLEYSDQFYRYFGVRYEELTYKELCVKYLEQEYLKKGSQKLLQNILVRAMTLKGVETL